MAIIQPLFTTRRQHIRYALEERVEVVFDRQIISIGQLIDISQGGAGFEAYTPLRVGTTYTLSIRNVTSSKFRILNRHSINRYGGVFMNSANSKERLEKILRVRGVPIT